MNVCIFSGYLLDKPELHSSPSGKSVCEVRMNIPRDYKSQDGQRLSDFITVVAWGRTADLLYNCEKGTRLNITTHVRTELYTDKNGIKRESHKYEIDRFEFAERKGAQVPQNASAGVSGGESTGDYVPSYTQSLADQNAAVNDSMVEIGPDEELPF